MDCETLRGCSSCIENGCVFITFLSNTKCSPKGFKTDQFILGFAKTNRDCPFLSALEVQDLLKESGGLSTLWIFFILGKKSKS